MISNKSERQTYKILVLGEGGMHKTDGTQEGLGSIRRRRDIDDDGPVLRKPTENKVIPSRDSRRRGRIALFIFESASL